MICSPQNNECIDLNGAGLTSQALLLLFYFYPLNPRQSRSSDLFITLKREGFDADKEKFYVQLIKNYDLKNLWGKNHLHDVTSHVIKDKSIVQHNALSTVVNVNISN